MSEDTERAQQRGIQSIEVGGQVLLAMVHAGRPMALKDVAREAGMPPAKAHPYLVSFSRLGLIEQDAGTGRYQLGPLALQLGLIAMQQASPVQAAAEAIAELVPRLGFTVAVSIWGTRGPTIVRVEESPAAIQVNMRHGTVFTLSGTATGRLFAAHLDTALVQRLLEEERKRHAEEAEPIVPGVEAAKPPLWRDFSRMLLDVRRIGLSRSEGETLPGINAMAAPVFDHQDRIVAAMTAIGPASIFDIAWDGPVARAMSLSAALVSQRLGSTMARPSVA